MCIMKIERINENKVKVTIPISYFIERNISFENFDYTSPAAQEFFCELMETLENDYGFSFINSQMIIESSSESSNDVVFTLTKPSIDQEELSVFQRYLSRKRRESSKKRSRSNICNSSNVVIFEFEDLDYICEFSKKSESLYKGFNSLYRLGNSYYLVLDRKSLEDSAYSDNLFVLLNEFGHKVQSSGFFEGYLNEYGKLIVLGNSLSVFSSYF